MEAEKGRSQRLCQPAAQEEESSPHTLPQVPCQACPAAHHRELPGGLLLLAPLCAISQMSDWCSGEFLAGSFFSVVERSVLSHPFVSFAALCT